MNSKEGNKDVPELIHEDTSHPSTPTKNHQAANLLTPSPSDGSHSTSSSKRRRLISFDSKTEAFEGRKLNYESTLPSDVSEGSVDDLHDAWYEETRRRTVKKLWEVNYGDEDDRLVQTTRRCKLYEFVTWYDVVKGETLSRPPWVLATEEEREELQRSGKWKYRGEGQVKFIQTLEEGYNCGMIRMEMIHEGTLNTLMCHELLEETMVPMASKKGKSYTWKCKDWAYRTMRRTFAIRFGDEFEAIKWKSLVEQSKMNNCRVRRGLDVPDTKDVDELSDVLKRMSTM